MSRMVDRLVREGLVVKESCEEDGRGADVALTADGARAAARGPREPPGGRAGEFLARFDDDELGELARRLGAHQPRLRAAG